MGNVKTSEITESIQFFASLVGTVGLDEDVAELANDYLLKLMKALSPEVDRVTAAASGIEIIKG